MNLLTLSISRGGSLRDVKNGPSVMIIDQHTPWISTWVTVTWPKVAECKLQNENASLRVITMDF
jgi:hypothetical protein